MGLTKVRSKEWESGRILTNLFVIAMQAESRHHSVQGLPVCSGIVAILFT